ncbi:alpha-glucuronidase [Duganella sp. Leaf126]|uniref:alpha-glucuronidase family glycosyl hydrolase n=1 Tax=Duganella sp. Leaf126 TaxID=1736266 RepID=UPI0006FDDD57|nr:alpha-glucuronidase family glycosyl hydrolase [Duganella sp. Leaf126]KQQ45122.1 alpha-glucuronidase [Duganella sp. Leaf126]
MHTSFANALAALLLAGAIGLAAAAPAASAAPAGAPATAARTQHTAPDEDGYKLWLRYQALAPAAQERLQAQARSIVLAAAATPTTSAAIAELQRGLAGMTGTAPPQASALADGALVLATPASMPSLDAALKAELAQLGQEGYLLRATRLQGRAVTLIAANADTGLLYGAFAWLRAAATGVAPEARSAPGLQLRLLNHWDNLDRHVERGYAGASIWDWWALPEIVDSRYTDYARANASLGINGTVLNNVNAKPEVLTAAYIAKAAAVADVLRPYGIRVFLSARFSTPLELKETDTADPLAPAVQAWWKNKADEIYRAIPDFGGFLVKANSEGQPGPQDYHRSHADGANMLAAALAPHHGIVMWRAFVYAPHPDPKTDRARQAYEEFKPLDGKFASNVIVQVKNGAIDFQPREPFHPLFGAMPHTPLMMEFQITKEYLGFSTDIAYLGTLFSEVLDSDTMQRGQGKGPTVAQVLEGGDAPRQLTGMAGVANIGVDRNWTGHHFDQANWYAFGRLAWNPQASAQHIAKEWAAQTFGNDDRVQQQVVQMLMMSRETVVDYMTPLGLHHLMGTAHHHGPAPWVNDLERPDWNPVYYHRAARDGIGFDRTASGTNALDQYAPALARLYADPRTTPDRYLLWFHHLPWTYTMASGRTLWAELLWHYDRGVAGARDLQARWEALRGAVDARRHAEVAQRLRRQVINAELWRNACIAYFQSVSGLPLPPGVAPPPQSLDAYKAIHFPYAPGRG